jgi:hypothetical protein
MTGPTGITGITGITGPVGPSSTTSTFTTFTSSESTSFTAVVPFVLQTNTDYAVSWFIRATSSADAGATTAYVNASGSITTQLLFNNSAPIIINNAALIVSGGVAADRFRTGSSTNVTFTLTGTTSNTISLSAGNFVVHVMKL